MVQDQAPSALTIGGFAAAGGVGVETVRFYQRTGLIRIPTRETGGRRYTSADLRRLRFIRQAQAAGFTLLEIRELLALDAGEDRARVRELAAARMAALDAKIAELQTARTALQKLAKACRATSTGPCPILASFDL
jgi:MerR family transcriptional regulator, mercuric resistance operon regulatory protein